MVFDTIKPLVVLLLAGMLAATGHAMVEKRPVHRVKDLLISKHLPNPLYQGRQLPWRGGRYDLKVSQTGKPNIVAEADRVVVRMPLEAALAGNLRQSIGSLSLDLDCASRFNVVGVLYITPIKRDNKISSRTVVVAPIPPVNAKCQGIEVPVSALIEEAFAQNKAQIEAYVDAMVFRELNGFGHVPGQSKLP